MWHVSNMVAQDNYWFYSAHDLSKKSCAAYPRLGGRNGLRSPITNLLEGSTAHYKEHSQQIEDNLEGDLSLGA